MLIINEKTRRPVNQYYEVRNPEARFTTFKTQRFETLEGAKDYCAEVIKENFSADFRPRIYLITEEAVASFDPNTRSMV